MKKIIQAFVILSLLLPCNIWKVQANNCTEANAFETILAIPKENIDQNELKSVVLKKRLAFTRSIVVVNRRDKIEIYQPPEDKNKMELIDELKKSGLFEIVEPNYFLQSDFTITRDPSIKLEPNDNEFKNQYYLDLTKVSSAWLLSKGAPGNPIAVLDSGIDYDNEDLRERLLPCINVVYDSSSCTDVFGHGTKVSTVIGAVADNKNYTAGVSWFNPILPIKVSDHRGIASVETIVNGINEAVKNNAKIIIISLSTTQYSDILRLTVNNAFRKGVLIFASSGNTGEKEIRYPAGFKNVIGVGSVNHNMERSYFSTQGQHIDLVAPGEDILVHLPGNRELKKVNGTSFSTPLAAGIASLVWAARPDYSNKKIRKILFQTAQDLGKTGHDSEYGYGMVNAKKAVEKALYGN